MEPKALLDVSKAHKSTHCYKTSRFVSSELNEESHILLSVFFG